VLKICFVTCKIRSCFLKQFEETLESIMFMFLTACKVVVKQNFL
jgi:hypothetical protein